MHLLTNSMEKSRWETDSSSASQENPPSPHFMEHEGSLPHSQVPATCPYHESMPPHPTSWRFILILPPIYSCSVVVKALRY